MISDKIAPRLVGAAFLFVFFASLISGLLLTSAVGSASISDILVNASRSANPDASQHPGSNGDQ